MSAVLLPQMTETELRQEFAALAEEWRQETMFFSSTSAIVSSFAYYRIIGLGRAVVPLILRDLQEHGGHWFLALRALTGENPVAPEVAGSMKKMTQAWLEWGRQHGLK